MEEALERFIAAQAEASSAGYKEYALAGAEACRMLLDRNAEPTAPLSFVDGAEIYQSIIYGRRGELDALRNATPRYRVASLLFGRKRIAHVHRIIGLIKATVLPADTAPRTLRRKLQAAYAGEYDYVADAWPEVAARITELDLYPQQPPRAVAVRQ